MRISDWSSDVCYSDLRGQPGAGGAVVLHDDAAPVEAHAAGRRGKPAELGPPAVHVAAIGFVFRTEFPAQEDLLGGDDAGVAEQEKPGAETDHPGIAVNEEQAEQHQERSEEHTSELQSLMRNSYAVFCLKKKKNKQNMKH